MYATVPFAYIAFALIERRRWKEDRSELTDQLVLLALAGFSMFLAIAPSPSLTRLSTVSPPALVLLAWLLNRPGKIAGGLKTCLGAVAVALAVGTAIHYQTRWRAVLGLPGGRTALSDPALYEEYRWVLTHTHPGQFFYGMPPIFLPFHLVIDTSDYTRPEQVDAAVQALKQHAVPLMITRGPIEGPVSESDHSGPFRDYVLGNYRMTRTFPNGDQVWEKTP